MWEGGSVDGKAVRDPGQVQQHRVVRRSQLSSSRRWLVDDMQRLGFGHYRKLPLCGGEPVIDPPPKRVRNHRFSGQKNRRQVQAGDFLLKQQHLEMFMQFDQIGDGMISRLEVRDGLPYDMNVTESAAT